MKSTKKILIILGCIFLLLAFVPTIFILLGKQMQGKYGEVILNFWKQPLYPMITIITIVIVFVILPIIVYKDFFKKK